MGSLDVPDKGGNELVPRTSGQQALFGRADIIDQLCLLRVPVLVLTGDSGIGKSALLRAVQDASELVTAPPPVTVRGTAGSLQRALLDGLGSATAELVRERGLAQQVGDRVVAAGKRLVVDGGKAAGKVVASVVLAKLKEGIGTEAVDLVSEFVKDLGEAEHESLLAQINAATDPDVADVVLDLAAEVADLAGSDSPIIIALDGVEALAESDQRLLVDIAGRLPKGVFLRLAYATYTEERAARVEAVLAVGETVREHAVTPLSVGAIGDWLAANGQSSELAHDVFDMTDGYALDVGDAIQHLVSTGEPAAGDPSQQFRARTLEVWHGLDVITKAAANQLVAFERPLPEEWLQSACGLGPAAWSAVVENLERARVLTGLVNDVPWFHPRRQAVILDELRDNDRTKLKVVAEQAIAAYLDYAKTTNEPAIAADIAGVVISEPSVLEGDPGLQMLAALNRDQLSVLAALVELYEPVGGLPPLAGNVLQHARDFFGGERNLVPALTELVELGMIASESDQHRADLLHLVLEGETALALVQGRALRELGRLPLPGLASSIFDLALRPRLEPFVNVSYGLGPGTMRVHVEHASVLGHRPGLPFLFRGQGHFLIVRAAYHDRPLSATVRFASSQDLENARGRFDGLTLDVLGGAFAITELIDHPQDAVPADRFVGAVERALGQRLARTPHLKATAKVAYDPDSYMDARVKTFATIAALCDQSEQQAFGLEHVPALHWYLNATGDHLIQAEVYGGDPRSVRHNDLPAIDDRFAFFAFAEAFDLGLHERLLRINDQGGGLFADDPVVHVIEELRQKARHVTRHQAQVRIEVEHASLETRLLAARRRALEDARALAANGAFDGRNLAAPQPQATYICLHRVEQRGFGSPLTFSYLVVRSDSGVEEVHLTDQAPPGFGSHDDVLRIWGELFGTTITGDFIYLTNCDATQGVAALLGYHPEDIVLVRPDDRPADAWIPE